MPSEVKQGTRYTYKDDLVIVKPVNFKPTPAFCPVCKCHMSGSEDIEAYNKFQCCQNCMLVWAEGNAKAWSIDSWRPSSEEVRKEKKKRIEQLRNLSINH